MKRPLLSLLTIFQLTSFAQLTADFDYTFQNGGCLINFNPDTIYFNNASTDATSYFWEFINESSSTDENPSFIAYSDIIVKLTAYNSSGDSASIIKAIHLQEPINATFSAPIKSCIGGNIEPGVSNQSIGSYSWDFGDGFTSQNLNPTHQYADTGFYTIQLIASNQCGADTTYETHEVSSTHKPFGSFLPSLFSACPGTPITFNNNSTTENSTVFSWDFKNGNTSNQWSPVETFNTTGNYNVELIASNNCGSDTAYRNIDISPSLPFTAFLSSSIPWGENACIGEDITFSISGINLASIIIDFGDGGISNQLISTHSYAIADTYTVKSIATNYCGDAFEDSIIVIIDSLGATVAADFFWQNACPGDTLYLNNSSTNASESIWDFGDGASSSDFNTKHLFNDIGPHDITLIAQSSCNRKDTTTYSIQLDSTLQPSFSNFSITPNAYIDAACISTPIIFTPGNTNYSHDHMWYFGDNTSSSSTISTHSYTNSGEYPVFFSVTNGCGNTTYSLVKTLKVADNIQAKANFDLQKTNFCIGETFELFDLSQPSPSPHSYWDMGDGNIISPSTSNISYEYDSAGTYEIKLIIPEPNSCGTDTAKVIIEVKGVNLSFDHNHACIEDSVFFNNTSSDNATDWKWDFGDGDTALTKNPSHIYGTPNTYNVRLSAISDGCLGTYQSAIIITDSSSIQADFDFTVVGDSVHFEDQSINTNIWHWNFGDNIAISSEQNPTWSFENPSVNKITLTVSNSCGLVDSITKFVIIGDTNSSSVKEYYSTENWIKVSPNPFKDQFIISNKTLRANISIEIYDLNGMLVKSIIPSNANDIPVNTSDMPSGMYVVKVYAGDNYSIQRIIKH